MKLLIAEDDTDIARALRALLEYNNYTVDTVANGNDAYAYCLTGNYDGIDESDAGFPPGIVHD